MCFDSTHAPVATAARAAGTGLVSMSTRPDMPGMLHLEREARDWSTYNEYSYRIIRANEFLIDTSLSTYQGGVRIMYHIRTTWYQLVCTWYEPAPKTRICRYLCTRATSPPKKKNRRPLDESAPNKQNKNQQPKYRALPSSSTKQSAQQRVR